MSNLLTLNTKIQTLTSGLINSLFTNTDTESLKIEGFEEVLTKERSEITVKDFVSLSEAEALHLGFRTYWIGSKILWLIPAYLWTFIPKGLELITVSGDEKQYESYLDLSSDQRQGLLGYGLYLKPSNSLMCFSDALKALKEGRKITRSGWNGKDMYVVAQTQTTKTKASDIWNPHNKAHAAKLGGHIDVAPYCTLKTAQDTLAMGWIPSTGDLFAEDWVVVE